MKAGIEAINIYSGSASLDVKDLAKARNLDNNRFENLMMKEKSVPMPFEDPVSNGINAAKPIIDSLTEEERNSIDMVITCTESGIDFGKSISTYIHHYLGLNRNCRLFELKNACYSGTAGFQMAVNFVFSQAAPGRKVLVICTDIARMSMAEGASMDLSFFEPSNGSGAVAILVSDNPMTPDGVKTSKSDTAVTLKYVKRHIEIGIDALIELRDSGESVKHLRFE